MIQPRLIRLRDVPDYLGMDINRFNSEVRPSLTEIPVGSQGIAFDRLDLDAWVDHYKSAHGRPGKKNIRLNPPINQHSVNVEKPCTFSKKSSSSEFEKALELIKAQKRKKT